MDDTAIAFASAFDLDFQSRTSGLLYNEVPLFQAMHQTLVGLRANFDIEEYHGTSHQVKFAGNGKYARSTARCELSDLMIITYSSLTQSARLTYLQAKSEKAKLSSTHGHRFSANLEQWFLLGTRPKISGVGKFNPPSDLLTSALLPSVGSFCFFYKDHASSFQIYYAAANYLRPAAKYSQRYGKVKALGPCKVGVTATYQECLAACDNLSFAESLFRLEIGTPVDASIGSMISTRNWLAANLRSKISESGKASEHSVLARELLEILAPESSDVIHGSFGAKHLIIIKSDAEPRKLTTQESV